MGESVALQWNLRCGLTLLTTSQLQGIHRDIHDIAGFPSLSCQILPIRVNCRIGQDAMLWLLLLGGC